ncbi:hypothetical protein MUP01_01695 [Candidatus Bathyarchaeota archaeon]|nr:hypothetical protein [Candidatus Bathyarchaeota archaeon]
MNVTSSDKSIIAGFVSELSTKAEYGIRGEKPLAIIAVLKYTHESKILGRTLLELLSEPHAKFVRRVFLGLAETYSSIVEPQVSWDLIAGRNRELQSSIMQFRAGDVNKAFSNLTAEETESLINSYIGYLSKEKR